MPKLWIQVTPVSDGKEGAGIETIAGSMLAGLLSSGMGALIKTAADRLVADLDVNLSGNLAYEPAFEVTPGQAAPRFLIDAITVNVGPEAVAFGSEVKGRQAPQEGVKKPTSPLVLRIEFVSSMDRTAIAATVTKWRYPQWLDPRTSLREPTRKLTIEIGITDASGAKLVSTALQLNGTRDELTQPVSLQERLPWSRMPTLSPPVSPPQGRYGPVNIQVRITESSRPSWLGRLLSSSLTSHKAAIESYVKDRVSGAVEPAEAAKSRAALIVTAQAAWKQYAATHKDALAARATFDADGSAANKQPLLAELAMLEERKTLAQDAYERAGLSFATLPPIPSP